MPDFSRERGTLTNSQDIRNTATACIPHAVSAIDLLDVLVRYAHRRVVFEDLAQSAAATSNSKAEILALKGIFESHGIISVSDNAQQVLWSKEAISNLRWSIEGVSIGMRAAQSADEPVSVITIPSTEYDIVQSLRRRGVERATLGRTIDALLSVARAANSDFFVVTPFIDATGIDTLNKIVEAVPRASKCYLIVRTLDSILNAEAQGAGRSLSPRFAVFTYFRETASRQQETFHGKYFVGDDSKAYVGSANLLYASLESTVETGVLLSGIDARPWSVLAQAMLDSSTLVRNSC